MAVEPTLVERCAIDLLHLASIRTRAGERSRFRSDDDVLEEFIQLGEPGDAWFPTTETAADAGRVLSILAKALT